MRRERISRKRVEELVKRLAGGMELEAVLAEWGMTVGEAQKMLHSATARRVIQDVRALQALQRELVLGRLTAHAAGALERQMEKGAKAELQLRGAMTVLGLPVPGVAKGKGAAEAEGAGGTGEAEVRMTEEEMEAVFKESTDALAEEARERYAS